MNSYQLELLDEELAIIVTPSIGLDKKWNGNLNFKIELSAKSPLNIGEQNKLFTFMQMLLAVPELIESDDDLKDRLWRAVQINERSHLSDSVTQNSPKPEKTIISKKKLSQVLKFSDYKKTRKKKNH